MITILGASGFIGSNLVSNLIRSRVDCYAPRRNENLSGKNLGDIIYCIGLTADFRQRPFDTVNAHVVKLCHILQSCSFDSLTYLSSTRVYIHSNAESVSENSILNVNINDPFDLFNISKLMGESIIMNSGRPEVRIVRISNVYGEDFSSHNFLTTLIQDGVSGKIVLRTTPTSSKDYIDIETVCNILVKITLSGKQKIYNLASGVNTCNKDIVDVIHEKTRCEVEYSTIAEKIIFPKIDVSSLSEEFGVQPNSTLLADLPAIIDKYLATDKNLIKCS